MQSFRQYRYKIPFFHPALTQVQGPEYRRGAPSKPPVSRPRRRLPLAPPQSCARGAHTEWPPRTPAPWRAPRGGHADRPAASPAATGSPPAPHACPHPGAWKQLPARPARAGSRERGPRRGEHMPPLPGPQRHSLTQTASSSSSHAGPTRAIPRRRCLRLAPLCTQAPAPAAPPGPTASATSQPLPASEFPVPRLPKHAHQTGRGGREEVLAGSRSLPPGWAGGIQAGIWP